MGTYIIATLLFLALAYALYKIFSKRGKCCGNCGCCGNDSDGCCGGGGELRPEHKKLDGPVTEEKIISIDGMSCENCRNRVERAINKIDGASARVNLRKKEAVVSLDREIDDETLKNAVESAGYKVVSVKTREVKK